MDKNKCLQVVYQNVRGLRTKINQFYLNSLETNNDVIIVTESWLDDSIADNELFDDKYVVYRADRDKVLTGKSLGGGVLIAVNRNISSVEVCMDWIGNEIELKGVKVVSNNQTIFLLALYIPPSSILETYITLFSYLETLQEMYSSHILIIGDFNVPEISKNVNVSRVKELHSFMSFFDMHQCNSILNFNNVILDLAITNIKNCTIKREYLPLVNEDSHHPCLSIEISIPRASNKGPIGRSNKFNFKKADFCLMHDMIKNTDWNILQKYTTVDDYVAHFYKIINSILEKCVPVTFCSNKYPIWYDKKLINNIKLKKHYRYLYLKYRKNKYNEKFINFRHIVRNGIRIAYAEYLENCENNICTNSKAFWLYINSRKGNSSIPGNMEYNGECLKGGKNIAEGFAKYFSTVYKEDVNFDYETFANYYERSSLPNVNVIIDNITHEEIIQTARKIKNNAIGPDGIPGYIFRACIEYLVTPLHNMFNMALLEGVYPSMWKRSKIVPIFKSGNKSDITNYRAIAILSFPSKIFEQVLHSRIFCDIRSIITSKQHGFVPRRSTVTNLSCVTEYLANKLDKKLQVDIIYTDIGKAFDSINHRLLIKKMDYYGVSNGLLRLIFDYLRDRQLYVSINNFNSTCFTNVSGVPQGSNLGPLLFLIFFNDIENAVKYSEVLMFADDLKLYRTIRSIDDCKLLQHDLMNIIEWCDINDMKMNISKCSVTSYTKRNNNVKFDYVHNNTILHRKTVVSDLGVVFDAKLTFVEHIAHTSSAALKLLGFVIRNTKLFKTTKPLDVLYSSLIRSKLEYAVLIWFPIYDKHNYAIEGVQSKYLKCKYFREKDEYLWHCRQFLNSYYNMPTLESRRQMVCLLHLYDILNNNIDNPEILGLINFKIPRRNSRNCHTFQYDVPRTNCLYHAPVYRMTQLFNDKYNNLDLFNISKICFKRKLTSNIKIV